MSSCLQKWFALILLIPSIACAGWLYAGDFYVPDGAGTRDHNLIFVNSADPSIPPNQWVTIDTTANFIPADATAIAVHLLAHAKAEYAKQQE